MVGNPGKYRLSRRLIPAIALCAAAIGIGLAFYFSASASSSESEETSAVTVSSRALDFGLVALRDEVTRQLVLRNESSEPLRADLSVRGAQYGVEPSTILLHPGINFRIEVSLRPSDREGAIDDALEIRVDGDDAPLVVKLAGHAHADSVGQDAPGPSRRLPTPAYLARQITGLATTASSEVSPDAWRDPVTGKILSPAQAREMQRAGRRGAGNGDSADASRAGAAIAGTPSTTSIRRQPAGSDGSDKGSTTVPVPIVGSSMGLRVLPENPSAPPPPPTEFDDRTAKTGIRPLSESDRRNARELPSEPDDDVDGSDREIDDDRGGRGDDDDPFTSPTLAISATSQVGIIGDYNYFYPQAIGVLGSDAGGPLQLAAEIQFPQVNTGMGQSIEFRQASPISGTWNPGTGEVRLQFTMRGTDSDNRAAVFPIELTTGMSYGRDDSGTVLALPGMPRNPLTGHVTLVGLGLIPAGVTSFGNQLVRIDLRAKLDFGPAATPRAAGR